jgi:hypothetical protein
VLGSGGSLGPIRGRLRHAVGRRVRAGRGPTAAGRGRGPRPREHRARGRPSPAGAGRGRDPGGARARR